LEVSILPPIARGKDRKNFLNICDAPNLTLVMHSTELNLCIAALNFARPRAALKKEKERVLLSERQYLERSEV
jgi:hypothetical protein